MYALTTSKSIGCGLALGLVASSCGTTYRTLHDDHCANQDGDAWCRDKYADGSRSYCSRGISECEAVIELNSSDLDGCVAVRPAEDACYSPCGGRMDVAEDASCLGAVSSTSESDTSTGSTTEVTTSSGSGTESSSTTGPMPCTRDQECTDDAAPFCEVVSGECVACDGMADPDAACAGADPGLPLCVGGTCVACTPENPVVCEEQLLLCDGDSNACVPCEEHAECSSGACELAVGTCFPPGEVVHVDGDGGQDFPSVAAAVASVAAGGHGVIVVHEQDSGLGYPSVLIDGGKTIALLNASGEAAIIQGTGGNPGLRVDGAGTVLYADGLRLAGNTMGLGLLVNGALAWVDRSRIVQNSGGGVLAEAGAELTLRDCFVDGAEDVDAVFVDSANVDVLYTTIGGGNGAFGQARALGCTPGVTVDIRNSILMAIDDVPELACNGAVVSNTATETAVAGPGNQTLGPVQAAWFTNYTQGDFSLASPPVVIATTAVWDMGDPLTDIDGDPRPGVVGSPDYAGADVP